MAMITRSFDGTVCWPMPRSFLPESSATATRTSSRPPSRPRGGP